MFKTTNENMKFHSCIPKKIPFPLSFVIDICNCSELSQDKIFKIKSVMTLSKSKTGFFVEVSRKSTVIVTMSGT